MDCLLATVDTGCSIVSHEVQCHLNLMFDCCLLPMHFIFPRIESGYWTQCSERVFVEDTSLTCLAVYTFCSISLSYHFPFATRDLDLLQNSYCLHCWHSIVSTDFLMCWLLVQESFWPPLDCLHLKLLFTTSSSYTFLWLDHQMSFCLRLASYTHLKVFS